MSDSQETKLDDLVPQIAEMSAEELDELEEEESAGKARTGVYTAITARREALEAEADDDEEDDEEAEEDAEEGPTEADAAEELAKVEAAASAPRDVEDVDDTEYEPVEAPVDEIPPVIHEGDWVTLGAAKSVPKHLVNKDAVVVTATVRQSEGGDTLSPSGYEYQLDSDEFLVKARETGETLTVTRGAVINHGTQQSELGFRS